MTKVDIVLEKTQLNDQIITAIGTDFRVKLQQNKYNIDTDNVTMKIVGRPDFYYGLTKPGRLTTIIYYILFVCLARCFVAVLFVVTVARRARVTHSSLYFNHSLCSKPLFIPPTSKIKSGQPIHLKTVSQSSLYPLY